VNCYFFPHGVGVAQTFDDGGRQILRKSVVLSSAVGHSKHARNIGNQRCNMTIIARVEQNIFGGGDVGFTPVRRDPITQEIPLRVRPWVQQAVCPTLTAPKLQQLGHRRVHVRQNACVTVCAEAAVAVTEKLACDAARLKSEKVFKRRLRTFAMD
jgi:hypothetical protein